MTADDLWSGTIGEFDLMIDGPFQSTILYPYIAFSRCGDTDHRIEMLPSGGICTGIRSQRRRMKIGDGKISQCGPVTQNQKSTVLVTDRVGYIESSARFRRQDKFVRQF